MLSETDLEKYSEALAWAAATARGGELRKSAVVVVTHDPLGLPLAETLYELLIDRGLNPVLRQRRSTRVERAFLDHANPKRLLFRPPGEQELYRAAAAEITIIAPDSLNGLLGVDPAILRRTDEGRRPVLEIVAARERDGELGRTACVYPVPALAEAAGRPLPEYEQALARGCLATVAQPASEWRRVKDVVDGLAARLTAMKIARLVVEGASEGAEPFRLIVPVGRKRRWLGVTGRNLPGFEVYFSPDWRGVEGTFHADVPSWRLGGEISSVRLEFKAGRLVGASARRGEDLLIQELKTDPGSCSLGEFSLTDRRISRLDAFMAHPLLDENLGGAHGNCHIALGSAYELSYDGETRLLNDDMKRMLGFNVSNLHWDMVHSGPRQVRAVQESGAEVLLYENGEFAGV